MESGFFKTNDGQLTLCAFRAYKALVERIHDAAKSAGMNQSDWLRSITNHAAAAELRIEPLALPNIRIGKSGLDALVTAAAEKEGVSPEEFARKATEAYATRVLGMTPPGGIQAVRESSAPPPRRSNRPPAAKGH